MMITPCMSRAQRLRRPRAKPAFAGAARRVMVMARHARGLMRRRRREWGMTCFSGTRKALASATIIVAMTIRRLAKPPSRGGKPIDDNRHGINVSKWRARLGGNLAVRFRCAARPQWYCCETL